MIVKIGTLGTMKADFVNLRTQKTHLIATMEVREGVKYEIVGAVSYKEIWQMAKAIMAPSILWYLISGWARKKEAKPPKL